MRLFPRREAEAPAGLTKTDLEHAYDRGRHDERKRHHSHPILGLIIAALAILGVGAVYLGLHEGSFSKAGQVVDAKLATADAKLATAADRTQVASLGAAQKVADAGSAAQQAGQTLRQNDAQQPQTQQY